MPPKKKLTIEIPNNSGMINFYENKDVQPFVVNYHNPAYNMDTMPLKHPMFGLICGSSGSGKTLLLMNIIAKLDSTFNFIRIVTANKHEPLYEWLESKIDKPYLEIYEGLKDVEKINLDQLESAQYLFVFDDMNLVKDQSFIELLFKRGRKLADKKGVSVIYLSQSYFSTPIFIRKNLHWIILKKVNGQRDLTAILRDTSIDASKDQLLRMYGHCVQSKDDVQNCMFIDLASDDEHRFRKNFNEVLNPDQF
jgi:hypothetical protein